MTTRYLEISSSYRNRDEYPNPSEFNVIVGNYTESFPQITSFPQYTFNNNDYGIFREPFTNGNIARPSLTSTSAPASLVPVVYPTYAGYMMFAWDTIFPTPAPTDSRVVVKYNDINNTFTMSSPLSLTVGGGSGLIQGDGQVLDPSPCKTIGDPNNSATWNTPYTYYNIQSFSNVYYQFPVLTQSTYVGSYLMYEGVGSSGVSMAGNLTSALGVPEGRTITSIDPTTLQITIDSPFSYTIGTPANMLSMRQFSIRKTLPILVGSCQLVAFTNNILNLGSYASSEDNIYKDAFLYIRPIYGDTDFPNILIGKNTFSNYIYKILKYDGSTKLAYLDRSIDPGIPIPTTSDPPFLFRVYEIMRNTEASWSPLLYTGSSVVRPDPICMRVGLTALILPNVLLTNGNRIAFYPFVYVELRNTSSKTVGTDIIYSNNPNSHRAIFIVPITDIRNPRRSPFIKLKSKMKQTIKFKPNDSFIFRVYLPDGSPFQPIQTDNPLPLPPNPLLQLEAVFNYTPV